MGFLFDKLRSGSSGNSAENIEDKQKEKFRGLVESAVEQRLTQVPENIPAEKRYEHVLASALTVFGQLFPELESQAAQGFKGFLQKGFKDDSAFRQTIVPYITSLLLHSLSLAQIEEGFRKSRELQGEVVLSRILTYEYKDDDTIYLHVPPVFTSDPLEMRELFVQGLRELATVLRSNERLRGVKFIRGRSHLIKNWKSLIHRAGFETSERTADLSDDEARITVDDFLKRYSSTT